MTAALENAKKEFGENSEQVRSWQIKINKAETELAKTEKTLNETTKQVDNFGDSTDKTGNKMSNFKGILAGVRGGGWSCCCCRRCCCFKNG